MMHKVNSKVIDFINKNSSFNIFVHTSPDGDCVGSSLGLARYFLMNGKECRIITDCRKDYLYIKSKIDFCSATNNVVSSDIIVSEFNFEDVKSRKTVNIFVDCADISRIGKIRNEYLLADTEVFDILRTESLIIDHHINNNCESKLQYVRPEVASASELVTNVIEHLNKINDTYMATALFYGIASDTGVFRFLNKDNAKDTFSVCSRLVSCSVSPDILCACMEGGKDKEYNDYFISIAESAHYLCDGKVVLLNDDLSLLNKYTKNKRPSDELYRFFMKIKGVEVVIFVKYSDDKDFTDVSIRVSAFSDFNANEFCKSFGGGGHIKASGFHAKIDYDYATESIIRKIENIFNNK